MTADRPLISDDGQCLVVADDLFAAWSRQLKGARSRIAKRPLAPLAFLEIQPKPDRTKALADADGLLRIGWVFPGVDSATSIMPPLRWNGGARSFEFHLHAWQPVQRLLLAFDLSRQWVYLDAALNIAEDWLDACPIRIAQDKIGKSVRAALDNTSQGNWWYDMAVAQRLHRMSFIVDVACRTPEVNDARIDQLMEHVLFHHVLLSRLEIYRSNTNHGFFQALNQVAALQRLPELDMSGCFLEVANNRLEAMVGKQFLGDDYHAEHSPGYHYMVTVALMNARRAGTLGDKLVHKLKSCERNLGWFMKPSGNIVTFGDSDPRLLNTTTDLRFFDDPELLATLRGADGTPYGVQARTTSGYAFARMLANDVELKPENATYLAQIAAFHSRVHKHADHLSFVWYDRNRDVLIDPARYAYVGKTEVGGELYEQGFWYSDPKRIYCETTRAHNCLEIDGKSYPRYRVKPFGSALVDAFEQDGLAVTDCAVTHFRNVRHRRHLIMRPGHFLLVLDWAYDRSGDPHDYKQWFHFDPAWQVEHVDGAIKAFHPGDASAKPQSLRAASLVTTATVGEVVRGQQEPELLGWMSDKAYSLVPTSCFPVSKSSSDPTIFATLFTFGDVLIPDWSASRFNATMKTGQAVWLDQAGQHTVTIDRQDDRPLRVKYQRMS